jgi:hypothetical protein
MSSEVVLPSSGIITKWRKKMFSSVKFPIFTSEKMVWTQKKREQQRIIIFSR